MRGPRDVVGVEFLRENAFSKNFITERKNKDTGTGEMAIRILLIPQQKIFLKKVAKLHFLKEFCSKFL